MTRSRKVSMPAPGEPVRIEHARELVDIKTLVSGRPPSLSVRLLAAFGLYNAINRHLPGKGRPKGGRDDDKLVREAVELIRRDGIKVNRACKIVAERHRERIEPESTIRRLSPKVRAKLENPEK